ncbi:efflux RND transporter periplasmic adaptor subunit, partial [Desulfolithobacter sp.]
NLRAYLGVMVLLLGWLTVGRGLAGTAEQATVVTVSPVIRDTLVRTEEAMGWIEAVAAPTVTAEVLGRVETVLADAGQGVEAGAVLATIDDSSQRLEIEGLEAEVQRIGILMADLRRTVDRYQRLVARKALPQEQLDSTRARLQALSKQQQATRARLEDAKRRLNKTMVRAPVTGRIERRLVSAGDFVDIGTPLYRMVRENKLRIILPFPENAASRLRPGQKVILRSPLMPEHRVTGRIDQLRPAIKSGSRAIETITFLENPGSWRPGGTVNGTVITAVCEQALLVPARAVVRRPAGEVVYQVLNRTARQVQVTTGQRQGNLVEIVSGLSGDEKIAVDGAGFLSDGVPVVEQHQ